MNKKIILFVLCAVLSVFTVIGLSGCGKSGTDTSTGEEIIPGDAVLTFKTLEVDGTDVYGRVSSETETFSFAEELTVGKNCYAIIGLDKFGIQTVTSREVPLKTGDNVFYVFKSVSGELVETYRVVIRRSPVFTVTFDTVGGTEIQPQVLDEGSLANRPETDPERNGYAFYGWNFNFDEPITGNVTVRASWQRVFNVSGNTITGLNRYCDKIEKIVIPNSIDGVEITKISAYAFEGVQKITSVVIQEGITTIGDYAFHNCANLVSIEIPESVTAIGSAAFFGCGYIENAVVPISAIRSFYNFGNGLKTLKIISGEVEEGAFGGFNDLVSVEFTNKVTSIGERALANCPNLTNVILPENLTTISDYLFSDCAKLTSIEIPGSVTSIGEDAFAGCANLTSIELPESVTSIGDFAFAGCANLTSIELPESVTSIGDFAFAGCANLTSIEIPGSVTSIGEAVFYECSSLESIKIPDGITSIGYAAFYACASLESIEIPSSVTSIGYAAFYECTGLMSIELPESVTSIEIGAFYACASLESIEIPSSVTSIGYAAFYECVGLTSIEIPDSVTSIGYGAFAGCGNLAEITVGENNANYCSVDNDIYSKDKSTIVFCSPAKEDEFVIPEGVTTIADGAFMYSKLKAITIPESVTSIGEGAFAMCENLTSLEIPSGVTVIPIEMAYGCVNLTSVSIPSGVTSIGDNAFYACTSLTSIEIPNSVTSIGEGAFYGCENLTCTEKDGLKYLGDSENPYIYLAGVSTNEITTANIESGCKFIGDLAFYCINISEISIPEGVLSIGAWAFANCTALNEISIPQGVVSIGSYAFSGCKNLTSVEIPNSVTSIGYFVFEGCKNLTYTEKDGLIYLGSENNLYLYLAGVESQDISEVTIEAGCRFIGEDAFFHCGELVSITIPEGVVSIGSYAFYGCEKLESVIFSENATWIVDDQLGSVVEIDLSNASLNVIYLTEEFYNCQWYKK